MTLDLDGAPIEFAAGDRMPPLWHFTCFLEAARRSELGRDGHPRRGEFLPPVALPRRMWAGGSFTFHGDLHIGESIERTSTITDVRARDGKSGPLIFVTIEHSYTVDGDLRMSERKELVYRDNPGPSASPAEPPPSPDEHTWSALIEPDPVLLFRYSALTFNNHRIHYDREYTTSVEQYPGLIVHGPLTATLLAAYAESWTGQRLATFTYRGTAPLFDTEPFTLHGVPTDSGAHLWAATPNGGLAMTAEATFIKT